MRARRVASIDVGTNTVLLLIAEGDADSPRALVERATITRLGAGVDRTGRLAPDAIERTVSCLFEYGAAIRQHQVDAIDVVCTSAARDAENGAEFIERAERALGATPRIIDGEEEAMLTFEGALTGLGLRGEVTVFDIGGGSTEIIQGFVTEGGARVDGAVSLDVGSVRLTERHVTTDPPRQDEIARVRSDVELALADVPRPSPRPLVGVAGTITTLAAIHAKLDVYDSARVHGSGLDATTVDALLTRLSALPLDARRAIPGLEPARADVIVAGAVIAQAVLAWAGADALLVSDRGVRWGLARAALGRSDP